MNPGKGFKIVIPCKVCGVPHGHLDLSEDRVCKSCDQKPQYAYRSATKYILSAGFPCACCGVDIPHAQLNDAELCADCA